MKQAIYMLAFIWPKAKEGQKQWISGTEVGVDPTHKIRFQYPGLKRWDGDSPSLQGINVLADEDFDLNILTPHLTRRTVLLGT